MEVVMMEWAIVTLIIFFGSLLYAWVMNSAYSWREREKKKYGFRSAILAPFWPVYIVPLMIYGIYRIFKAIWRNARMEEVTKPIEQKFVTIKEIYEQRRTSGDVWRGSDSRPVGVDKHKQGTYR